MGCVSDRRSCGVMGGELVVVEPARNVDCDLDSEH